METNIIMTSASGHQLKILGKVKNVPINIAGQIFYFDAYVTENFPTGIIAGVDFILKYKNVIKELLDKNIGIGTESHHILSCDYKEQERLKFINKFNELFAENIDQMKLSNIGFHKIDTIDDIPVKGYNGRIPIHLEEKIEIEIKKLHDLGIIQNSESEWCNRLVPVINPIMI